MVEVDFVTLPDFADHINTNPADYDPETVMVAREFRAAHQDFVDAADTFKQAMTFDNLKLKPQYVQFGDQVVKIG